MFARWPSPVRPVLVFVFVLLLGPSGEDVHAQNRTRFLHWIYQDAGALARSLAPHSAVLAAGSLSALIPTTRLGLDRPLLDEVQQGYDGRWAHCLDVANLLGEQEHITWFSAGAFVASLATRNTRLQNAAFTSLQALVYTDVATRLLKGLAGRARPSDGGDTDRFRPFSGRTSFPSGHTAAAFAVVGAWVFSYPHPATYALFALSMGTALARVAHNRHWPSDVLAGAAIGVATARFLVRRHRQKEVAEQGVVLRIVPHVGLRSAGLSLAVGL